MWVLDHLDDLASDFSVFHRVDDITELDGPRFFSWAHRIGAYGGVIAARAAAEELQKTRNSSAARGGVFGVKETSVEQLTLDGLVEYERR